jgi:methylene-tetrahydromethanopterin dehydrogenase
VKKLETLEITPLKDKTLNVLIVEKEFNEPFWLLEPSQDLTPKKFSSSLKVSIAFSSFLEKLLEKVKADFATEELGMRSMKEFHEENTLAQLFKKNNIPLFPVDIDENAKAYLASSLDERIELRDRMLKALDEMPSDKAVENTESSMKKDYLTAYIQCLQKELEEAEGKICFSVRESWIVKAILDNATKFNNKEDITCIHISSPEHVSGIGELLKCLDVKVETVQLSQKLIPVEGKYYPPAEELADLLESMQIHVRTKINQSGEDAPHLLFFLDTGKKASPFDICMAYDAGFSAVIPYENVTSEDAKKIVQDAIFSRDPKGIRRTCFFIGGKDMESAEEILKVAQETMFPPFEASIIIDPSGAYTTAAAMIAKVEKALLDSKLGELKDKCCAVFGTGAVGRIASALLARLGCNVAIVSPNPSRSNGNEYVEKVSQLLREKYGVNVEGVYAPTPAEKTKILKKADVILCSSAPGARVIEKKLLKELKLVKVMADINAVPPLGIELIKLEDDMREIAPGIFGIGALTIGRLKYKLEKRILQEARNNGKREIYNYNFALQLARRLLAEKLVPAELAVTLKYPGRKYGKGIS